VATYAVTQKLFLVTFVVGFVSLPLWPAIGEAISRGDHQWASRALTNVTSVSVGTTCAISCILVVIGRPIIAWWGGASVVPSHSMLAAFATSSAVSAYIASVSALLNNHLVVWRQVKLFGACSLVSLVAKPLLLNLLGPPGPVWATGIVFAVGYVWPARRLVLRTFAELECNT
jgi:O-antigen/teichoic acid export membrane protein